MPHKWTTPTMLPGSVVRQQCLKCGMGRQVVGSKDPSFYVDGERIVSGHKTPPCNVKEVSNGR